MDLNSSENGEPKKPEEKPVVESRPQEDRSSPNLPKIRLPVLKFPSIRGKFSEYGRVLKVTKKPSSEEFKAIVKASGLGILLIGFIGFIIAVIVQVVS